MKKKGQKLLALVLCMVTVFGMLSITASAKTITQYSRGDIIEFGWYPQSKVTSSSTVSQLNGLAPSWMNWKSYGYYSGTGKSGEMTAKNFMRYVDVTLENTRYRGVRFTEYRPIDTASESLNSNSYQDDNGYYTNNTYWFKFEPLKWCVLNPSDGLILSEKIIDSQAYNNYVLYEYGIIYGNASKTCYGNNYVQSSLRQWLNTDFYNTAFTQEQRDCIQTTQLDNRAISSSYSCAATSDYVFLLSIEDAINPEYGFSSSWSKADVARMIKGSDYAKCQGLYANYDYYSPVYESSYWRLRTAGDTSRNACCVRYDGYVFTGAYSYVDNTSQGVRPALRIDLLAEVCNGHVYTSRIIGDATCTANGMKEYTCSKCGSKYTDVIIATGHRYVDVVTPPTRTEKGYTTHTCSRCMDSYIDSYTDTLPAPVIQNYVAERVIDYKATVTFTATISRQVSGAQMYWFLNGESQGTGSTFTVREATKNYNIVAKYMKDGKVLAETETEKVIVNDSFFAKIKAFFRSLFKKLPVVVQEYVWLEKT